MRHLLLIAPALAAFACGDNLTVDPARPGGDTTAFTIA